jgi:signal transduction histidine kinase
MVVERYGQAAELQILGNSKRIQTRVTLPSPPVAVQADAHRLMQILTNLLSNAYKYASEDTVVTVQVSLHDQMAQVAVIDQGMGIAEADQNQLFTMFFRAAAVRPRYGAQGWGSISRGCCLRCKTDRLGQKLPGERQYMFM